MPTTRPVAHAARRSRFLFAATLFFASGALGLGYELVWIKKAALVVGASQLALATVLTSFFLGLGLGSLVVGRRLRSARFSPLATYGLFELGIGVYALAFPHLFELLELAYGALYPLAAGSGAALFALRFVLLFALCLPPTFLMGGTLPLLLDGLVREDRAIGAQTSLLYGLNILGAVAGVLLTAYFAIPLLGMSNTSRVGGLCNLAIGALALAVFRRSAPVHPVAASSERTPGAFVALAFASGAVAIGWQVMHARFFSLLDVTTVHSTSMLLAVYLLGLSLGSLGLSLVLRRGRDPLRVFGVAQLCVPIVGLYAFHAVRWIALRAQLGAMRTADGSLVPLDTMHVRPSFAFFSEDVDRIFFGPLAQTALVVLVPVLLLGACLPALIAGATRHAADLRATAGKLVFWNTLGSSLGAFVAGYVLLPWLGLHFGLGALAASSVALGAFALLVVPRAEGRSSSKPALALLAASAAVALAFTAFDRDLTRTAIERYGLGALLDDPSWQSGPVERPRLGEVVEGTVGTSYIFDSQKEITLASGAVAFAAVAKHGIPGQAIQGHIPMLFFPGTGTPRRCLGICMGSGQSFGAMLLYPIESLDVVDIAPSLVDLSLRHFADYNHGLAEDERVTFHFDDGRHFVQRSPDEHYDVISMEPPPPNADGVYSLYSLEFYREVERALSAGGVFMQWLPLYRTTPEDTLGIVATQAAVFPDTIVVKQADADFMVLSYKSRPSLPIEALRRRCEIFARERGLAGARWQAGCKAEIASVEGVLSTLIVGPESIARLEAPALYDDERQLLSYGTGDRWLNHRYQGKHLARISFAALPLSPIAEFAGFFDPPLNAAQIERTTTERAASLAYYMLPLPADLDRLLEETRSGADTTTRLRAHLNLAGTFAICQLGDEAFAHLRAAIALDPTDPSPDHLAAARPIVRPHFAAHRDETLARIDALEREFPAAPMVRALRAAFVEADRFDDPRRARYLFPER